VETATRALHRLTSYEPDKEWTAPADDPRIVHDLETNDMSRLPWFFKRYPESLPRVELPRDLPRSARPAIDVLAGIHTDGTRLDVPHLARLLHLCAGVVRTSERAYGTHPFRAAGSAGGRFPLEVYVAVPRGTPMPAGVHWYDPLHHALVQVGPPPRGEAPAVVVTGVPWRTGWRYRERGYRHVYWDAGTMLSQLLVAAESAGLAARLHTRLPDATVGALAGADMVHEWPVAVVALGHGAPALDAGGDAATGAVDADPLELPLVTAAQRAGESDALGLPWERGEPVDVPAHRSDPVEAVVLARGSQRRMDRSRSLPRDALIASMRVALRGIALPHRVVVHAVDGISAGLYRWPDLSVATRAGDMRDELYRVALKQGLAADASFVVIAAADVAELDDHQYRDAHLAAGLGMGRLHLAAYALGASASGMTFADSEIHSLLGEPLDALLFTCVGVPEYRSKSGGLPGSPTAVSQVTPRVEE
jgi:hypothetical protein